MERYILEEEPETVLWAHSINRHEKMRTRRLSLYKSMQESRKTPRTKTGMLCIALIFELCA